VGPKLDKETLNRIFTAEEQSRIIEMAWEDRITFEAIELAWGIDEPSLMKLMQKWLKRSSYVLWRKRVRTKSLKHAKLRPF